MCLGFTKGPFIAPTRLFLSPNLNLDKDAIRGFVSHLLVERSASVDKGYPSASNSLS